MTFKIERVLIDRGDVLLVAEDGGLHRLTEQGGRSTEVVLENEAKDIDAHGGLFFRLERDRISIFRRVERSDVRFVKSLPGVPGDFSLAVGEQSLYLHSPADPENVLVVERDYSGERKAVHLPVQRDLLALVLGDADRLLEDTGRVRAIPTGFVFVPLIRDPIEIVESGGRTTLHLAAGARGRIHTTGRTVTQGRRACPTCPLRRQVETRQDVTRLYADAAVGGGAIWALRLDPPGSARGLLHRVALAPSGTTTVHSWRLSTAPSVPGAVAVRDDTLVVASEREIRFYPLPSPIDEVACLLETHHDRAP